MTFVSEQGPLTVVTTDIQGKFKLPAVPTGPTKVMVVVNLAGGSGSSPPAITTPPKNAAESEAYRKQMQEMARAKADAPQAALIPVRYTKHETTPLTYTIKPDGDNHFVIKIED